MKQIVCEIMRLIRWSNKATILRLVFLFHPHHLCIFWLSCFCEGGMIGILGSWRVIYRYYYRTLQDHTEIGHTYMWTMDMFILGVGLRILDGKGVVLKGDGIGVVLKGDGKGVVLKGDGKAASHLTPLHAPGLMLDGLPSIISFPRSCQSTCFLCGAM